MKLRFITRSTRDEFFADTKESFSESIHDKHDYYYFHFDIYVDYRGRQVAEVHGFAFDEEANDDNNYAIGDIADDLSGDAGTAIYTMLQSDVFNDILLGSMFTSMYSVYIDKVYVVPDYRCKGIGKYIFLNLKSILQHAFNINTRCFTIVPKPQKPGESSWENEQDPDGEKRKLMIRVIEKAGYKQIEESEVWAQKGLGGLGVE